VNRRRRQILQRSHGPEACQAKAVPGCSGVAHEAHELANRSQVRGAAEMVALMIPVCRPCHEWIGRNRDAAHDAGLILWRAEALDPEAHRAAWLRRLDRDMHRRPP